MAQKKYEGWTSDETIAMEFLAAQRVESIDGVVSYRELRQGSAREREAREALVRLLRGDGELSKGLRWRLSRLFAPNDPKETRMLVFKKRAPGIQANPPRDIEIARFIREEEGAGASLTKAKEAACVRFAVEARTVARAWKEHKDFWPAIPKRD